MKSAWYPSQAAAGSGVRRRRSGRLPTSGVSGHQAYLPTQEAPAAPRARVSDSHVPTGGRQGAPGATPERPAPFDPGGSPAWVRRGFRLTRSQDFDRAMRSGRSARSSTLAFFVSDNELGRPRVGFAVSRKLGTAVVRNRVRRRLRELVRPLAATTRVGRDVVIVARAGALGAEYRRLREELNELWMRSVAS